MSIHFIVWPENSTLECEDGVGLEISADEVGAADDELSGRGGLLASVVLDVEGLSRRCLYRA